MFGNLKVSQRLALGFGAMALLLLLVCGGAYLGMARTLKVVTGDIGEAHDRLGDARAMVQDVLEQDLHLRQVSLHSEVPAMEAQAKLARESGKRVAERLDKLLKGDRLDSAERGLLQKAQALDAQSRPLVDKAVGLAMAVMTEDAAKLLTTQVDPLSLQRREALNAFAKLQQQRADGLEQALQAEGRLSAGLMAGAAVLGLALAGLAGWLSTRSVTQPLHEALRAAGRVAEGDLSVRLQRSRGDEFGELLGALDRMADRLRGVISTIRHSSESVLMASGEIAAGNHDLSARTEQQAASLQATVHTIDQLEDSVRRNAEAAQQATRLAADASGVAGQGGDRVSQVVATMDEISASSRRIADIVGVIDGIAFQTNILALNAAVEAARAGEQGRGFAVVAGEVRNLAQRSAQAAREIKGLITANVEKVESGTRLAAEAGSTMADIVRSSEQVASIISEISHATQEQASGLSQVSHSVQQVDSATQQNAALVEQSAAAASSLKDQTATLNQAVGVFRMETH
ncbi:methyl-accepting chemotaxis protein [Ideonella sp. DXS22W]|uniref:Methyl-accepting chemotaxis protein n=1 Tax=Pseudaquabacterium inlustre TaxID=2984192 RepID=A0ABU9CJZ3_9BURK